MRKFTIYLILILILSSTVLAIECTDTDGEKIGNPTIKTETYPIKRVFLHESVFVKGTTTGETITHEIGPWTDECVDSNTLKEYWCDSGIPYARSESLDCPVGCSNSACIKPSCSQMNGGVCGTNEKCMAENQFITTDGLCCPYNCESTIRELVSRGWCPPNTYATQSTVATCQNNKQTYTNKDYSGNLLETTEIYCEVFPTTCPTVQYYNLKLQFTPKILYPECISFGFIYVGEQIEYDNKNDRIYFNGEMLKINTITKADGSNRIYLEGNANTGQIYKISIKSGEKICLYEPKEMEETPSQTAQVASNTIYFYLENLNSDYRVIVEDSASSSDSLAATDIVTGIQRATSNKVNLNYKLASENRQLTNLILIGHPCDNKLIPIDCNSWSYKTGEALIQISGSNLIVAGTTPDDTRRAAKIIANYKDYSELKQKDKIIVKGTTLETSQLRLQEQKPQSQMVCGDGICESGEICDKDCKIEPEIMQQPEQQQEIKKPGFFRRVFNWFKGLF